MGFSHLFGESFSYTDKKEEKRSRPVRGGISSANRKRLCQFS